MLAGTGPGTLVGGVGAAGYRYQMPAAYSCTVATVLCESFSVA